MSPDGDGPGATGATARPLFSLEDLEARYAAVAGHLEAVCSLEEREAVRAEIIDFFRDVDALHETVGDLRRRVKDLVRAFRSLPAGAPETPGRSSVHSDGLNSSTFMERGWNFIAAEKYGDAVKSLEKALTLWPANVEAEGLLGWALMKEGRYERALGCLQRVLLAEPSNDMARVNLGYICFRRGIHGEALEHLSGVVARNADRKAVLYAHLYLGLLYGARSELDEALAEFKRAIEVGPNMIEAYYHLGTLLYRHGKADQAHAVWRSAVARNAYNPYSKKAKALLEELDAGRPIEIS